MLKLGIQKMYTVCILKVDKQWGQSIMLAYPYTCSHYFMLNN